MSQHRYGCQWLGFLTSALTLTHALYRMRAALKADSGPRIPCRTGESNPRQYCAWQFAPMLYQLGHLARYLTFGSSGGGGGGGGGGCGCGGGGAESGVTWYQEVGVASWTDAATAAVQLEEEGVCAVGTAVRERPRTQHCNRHTDSAACLMTD